MNFSACIHWKVDHSPDIKEMLSRIGPVTVKFRAVAASPELDSLRSMPDVDGVSIGFSPSLREQAARDSTLVEASLGAALSEGLAGRAAIVGAEFSPESFLQAWSEAPRGFHSAAVRLPVRNEPTSRPIEPPGALTAKTIRDLAVGLKDTGVRPGRFEGADATQLESRSVAPILRAILVRETRQFERAEFFAFAFDQLEASLAAKWRKETDRKHSKQFEVLAYDPVQRQVVEEREAHKLSRAIALLIEEALVQNDFGHETVSDLDWMNLLTVGDLFIDSCFRSEVNHYGLVPGVTIIDERYKIRQETVSPPLDGDALQTARARKKRSDRSNSFLRSEAIRKEENDHIKRITAALRESHGFSLDAINVAFEVAQHWDVARGESFSEVTPSEFVDRIMAETEGLSRSEAEAAVQYLTLRGGNLRATEMEHWEQERRPVRLLTRPFVELSPGMVCLLPWLSYSAQLVFKGYLSQGRLVLLSETPSIALKTALDDFSQFQNAVLERALEVAFQQKTPYVIRNVKEPDRIGLASAGWAGEIDGIAIDALANVIWVADAKDSSVAFSPMAIGRSIDRFNKIGGYVEKLLKKAAAVAGNPSAVATALKVPNPHRVWRVIPVMVTRHVEPAAFTSGQRVQFCVLEDVEDLFTIREGNEAET
jgi:hypothetical protein